MPTQTSSDQPRPARSKTELDAYLTGLFDSIAQHPLPDLPSVVISGTLRCGKTKVSRSLTRQLGYHRLVTDEIRNATYLDCPQAEKRRIAKYVYRRILLRFPRGVLLDGTAALDPPRDLPPWTQARGIAFFAIGYSFDRPEDKHRDLLAYRNSQRCWTSRTLSDADMRDIAERVIRQSQTIRTYCAAHDLPYFDLDSARFDRERDRIVAAIAKTLTADQKNAPSRLMARLRHWGGHAFRSVGRP